jgi:hypothetical protein
MEKELSVDKYYDAVIVDKNLKTKVFWSNYENVEPEIGTIFPAFDTDHMVNYYVSKIENGVLYLMVKQSHK